MSCVDRVSGPRVVTVLAAEVGAELDAPVGPCVIVISVRVSTAADRAIATSPPRARAMRGSVGGAAGRERR